MSKTDIEIISHCLKSAYRNRLNFVLAIFVLSAGVAYRAISLDLDNDLELFKISIYIGLWFGCFAGFMTHWNSKRKLQMMTIGAVLSCSLSLFSAMLVTLMVGRVEWITSVNILASALGSMWLLTYYDEVLTSLDAIRFVNQRQLHYMEKATCHFQELSRFSEKINQQGRLPLTGEYWAFREWISHRANKH